MFNLYYTHYFLIFLSYWFRKLFQNLHKHSYFIMLKVLMFWFPTVISKVLIYFTDKKKEKRSPWEGKLSPKGEVDRVSNVLIRDLDNWMRICDKYIKRIIIRTSLVVQWLRIRLPMQGTRVRSLVGELRSHMPQGS